MPGLPEGGKRERNLTLCKHLTRDAGEFVGERVEEVFDCRVEVCAGVLGRLLLVVCLLVSLGRSRSGSKSVWKGESEAGGGRGEMGLGRTAQCATGRCE